MLESLIVVFSVLLDRFSKIWAAGTLKNMPGMSKQFIPGILEFRYVENQGAAFSMMWGMRWFFVVITTIIVIVLGIYLYKNRKKEKLITRIALSCVIGGAIGNLIDRALYGYVVDMFRPTFIDFAVFNVADIFVTVGTITLVIIILFFSPREKEESKHEPDTNNG